MKTLTEKYSRTNLFVIDQELWAWAQYEAKLLNSKTVSEFIFDVLKMVKETPSLYAEIIGAINLECARISRLRAERLRKKRRIFKTRNKGEDFVEDVEVARALRRTP